MVASDLRSAFDAPHTRVAEDRTMLADVVSAVVSAGNALRREFDTNPGPRDVADIRRLMDENDDLSSSYLRVALEATRPDAGWSDDEDGVGLLPPGEWWVTDPVEGNINKSHGMAEFCVSATLVRDNAPILAAVYLPVAGDLFTAVAGDGAAQNGRPMRVSSKTALAGAFVATSQNGADGDTPETMHRIGRSVTQMLAQKTIVRVSPPPTLQLVQIAAGRMDVFWQYSGERAGLLAGALMIDEAGGTVTEVDGSPWTLASTDICAAAPGLHSEAVDVLSAIS